MMFAACEKFLVTDDPFMAHHQVIIEHAWAAATEFGEGGGAQFDFDAGLRGEFLGAVVEDMLIFGLPQRIEAL